MEQMGNATFLICVAGSFQPKKADKQPVGGWGVIIQDRTDHRQKELRGRFQGDGSVFYMDLLGLLAALQDGMVQPGASVQIISKEQVFVDFINKGLWERRARQWLDKDGKVTKHADQWEQVAEFLKQYKWVKAEKYVKEAPQYSDCRVGYQLASSIAQQERNAARLRV